MKIANLDKKGKICKMQEFFKKNKLTIFINKKTKETSYD